MDEWLAKDFVTEIEFENLIIDPTFGEQSRPSRSFVDIDLYKTLLKTKDKIDTVKNWDIISRKTNPYEKISKNSKKFQKISRAYFKLYEILKYFDISGIKKSAHFCEAPGGFVRALLEVAPNVDWYAQSLYTDASLKIDPLLDNESKWVKGGDNTGNIYSLENIKAFSSVCNNADLITADGGFDVSSDPNNQEQLSLKLIYAEIIAALHCQALNGIFICKIFDSVTKPTVQLIYLIRKYYNQVYLIKPRTSRYSNSEKYIVAVGFKGIDDKDLSQFDSILNNFENESHIKEFFKMDETILKKMSKISEYNNKLIANQIKHINLSINCEKFNINLLESLQSKRSLEFFNSLFDKNESPKCEHILRDRIDSNLLDLKYGWKYCEKCLRTII